MRLNNRITALHGGDRLSACASQAERSKVLAFASNVPQVHEPAAQFRLLTHEPMNSTLPIAQGGDAAQLASRKGGMGKSTPTTHPAAYRTSWGTAACWSIPPPGSLSLWHNQSLSSSRPWIGVWSGLVGGTVFLPS
jgi:hypothetical protein